MKKIINGKVYNTYTAKSCGEYWNGYSPGDFNNVTEELFLKKTGEFFLHCYGGPMSKYGEWHGNMKTSSEKIKPLSYKEAREWAEEHLTADEKEFIK